jgi:hypothetical protein
MKTAFVASLATVASAMSGDDVINFTAGLFEGLIDKNDLPELQACMTDTTTIGDEVTEAVADFEKGDSSSIILGVEEMIKVSQQFPTAFSDCTTISDDVTAIENYFAQFSDISKASQIIFMNVLKNFSKIGSDIGSLETDFDNADYFQAGEDMASVLVDTLGPVEQTMFQGDKKQKAIEAAQFVEGFLAGILEKDQLPGVEKCVSDSQTLIPEVEKVMADVKAATITSMIEAAKILAQVAKDAPVALADCKASKSDLAIIKQWASQFTDVKTDMAIIAGNAFANYAEIKEYGTEMVADWSAKSFKAAGHDAAYVLTDVLGPIESEGISLPDKVKDGVQLVKGLLEGLIKGEFHDLDSCVENSEAVFDEVQMAVADFKKKDLQDIMKGITLVG